MLHKTTNAYFDNGVFEFFKKFLLKTFEKLLNKQKQIGF